MTHFKPTPRQWGLFFFLAMAWGSSYMWIKLALRELPPGRIATMRIWFATAALLVIFFAKKKSFPRDVPTIARLVFLSLFSIVVPFQLLTWGASQISSMLTGVLNGTVPLFTIFLAHFLLPGEQMNRHKFVGLILGMAGSVLLVASGSPEGLFGLLSVASRGSMAGALAVLTASTCYATGSILARRTVHSVDPFVTATVVTCSACIIMTIYEFTAHSTSVPTLPTRPLTWAALAWMGVVGSSIAYLIYFHMLTQWGAARLSFVMYLAPLVGIVLGYLFLGERPNALLYLGTALVFAGIAEANLRRQKP